jgi:hypothetical protein
VGSITTAMLNSFKTDALSALMCFVATVAKNGDTHTSVTVDGMANVTGIAVGMAVTGSGVAANTVVARILSATSVELSKATTTTVGATSLTFTGDAFKLALIKAGPTGTYNKSSTNYTDITGNSDEASGAGYSAGGIALTTTSPALSTDTACVDFADVSWTSATITTDGCMIYNNSQRGPTATRGCSTHSFGGTQTVTAGTLSLVFPTPDASNAILRIA